MCAINEPHPQDTQMPGAVFNDRWERKGLLHGNNLLVVEDWTGAITGIVQRFTGTVALHNVILNANPFAGELPEVIHAIAHTQSGLREVTTEKFFTATPSGKKVIVLHVGSTGPVPEYDLKSIVTEQNGAQFVWLRATDLNAYRADGWLDQFLELGFDDAKKLTECNDRAHLPPGIAKLEEDCPEFLDIILPGRIENRLAFRLLCEAAKAVQEENKKRKANGEQASATAKLSSITIHAPKDIGEWLAPFGGKGEEDIPRMAGMIGSRDVRTAARNILNLVNGKGDLSDAITKFLKPETKIS
jgi:hypothetical protein